MAPLVFAALLAAAPLQPAAAFPANPYTYEGNKTPRKVGRYSARELLEPLNAFPELLARAADEGDPERDRARERLAELAYPVGLALGEVNSYGTAPRFFKEELARQPADYEGIVRRFGEYQAYMTELLRQAADPKSRPKRIEALQGLATLKDLYTNDRDEIVGSFEFAERYRLSGYRPVDLQGDAALVEMIRMAPETVKGAIEGTGEFIESDRELENFEGFNPLAPDRKALEPPIEGSRNPIRIHQFEKMMRQVIAEEAEAGIPPTEGTPHGWSAEFLERHRGRPGFWMLRWPFTMSKLLMALFSEQAPKVLPTGQEIHLLGYLLSRPDESVTLDELFRRSYRLNNGDVYLTLLTAQNVLAEYWRTADRENRAVTRKLTSILSRLNDNDKFGSWYHLFGVMVYSYAAGENRALWSGIGERFAHHARDPSGVTQKDLINVEAAVLGASLKRIVEQGSWKGYRPDRDYTNRWLYLDRGEDFRDRMPLQTSPDLRASFVDGDLRVTSLEKDYKGCTVELFSNNSAGDAPKRKQVMSGVTLARGVQAVFKVRPASADDVRAFIWGCEGGAVAAINAAAFAVERAQ